MIGIHSTLIGGEDLSCYVDEVAIRHGRDDVDSQPEASTATLDLTFWAFQPNDLPPVVDVGAVVRVSTRVGGVDVVRFVGTITDVNVGWLESGELTPNAVSAQIIAAGPLADLGRRVVGAEPFPQELDGARVARILALAAMPTNPATSDPGVVQILPRDVDAQPALGLAQDVAQSASGMVWSTRDGEVRYADSEHRRRSAAVLTLDSCDVLVSPNWRRDTGGLVNGVSIGYGAVPEGGEQPRYEAHSDPSRARYGTFDVSVATQLAALADAQAMGSLLLTRNSSPVWLLSELPVAVEQLDEARTLALLELDVHALLGVTGMPAVGQLPTSTSLWVEGWTETLSWARHELSLYVSGFCRTAPAPRWDDVAPALTWDSVGPAMTWDAATCMGPLPSYGRWADVPASLRWDSVPAATTWDTWEG